MEVHNDAVNELLSAIQLSEHITLTWRESRLNIWIRWRLSPEANHCPSMLVAKLEIATHFGRMSVDSERINDESILFCFEEPSLIAISWIWCSKHLSSRGVPFSGSRSSTYSLEEDHDPPMINFELSLLKHNDVAPILASSESPWRGTDLGFRSPCVRD